MKSQIEIIDLRLKTHIGCSEQERSKLQDIAFDIIIDFDATKSCKTDDLNQTIDYMSIRTIIQDVCKTGEFKLIERLAWTCVEKIFSTFPIADGIHFKVKKFPFKDSENVSFELIARRG